MGSWVALGYNKVDNGGKHDRENESTKIEMKKHPIYQIFVNLVGGSSFSSFLAKLARENRSTIDGMYTSELSSNRLLFM